MAKEIITNVEALDAETERILAEAKTRASEIILEARAEANKILSSPLPLDAIRTERDTIVSKARAEADRKIRDSEQRAAEIRASADKRVKEITERVVNIVRGQS
jgi:vacuolar-type H+-ATPase subunit H